MNNELELKFWDAGQEGKNYSKVIWLKIIDALVNDFKKFIGHDFEQHSDIFLEIDQPCSPAFSIWMYSLGFEQEISKLTTKWLTKIGADIGIENEVSHYPIKWSAVMGGEMVATEKNPNGVFSVNVNMFVFRLNEEKRIHLKNNESIIGFVFEKSFNEKGKWKCIGWYPDYYDEWHD